MRSPFMIFLTIVRVILIILTILLAIGLTGFIIYVTINQSSCNGNVSGGEAAGNTEDGNDSGGSGVHMHSYTESVTAPTCAQEGYTVFTCDCGYTYTDNYTSELGHSYINYESDENATCTLDGTKTAKCERCSSTNTIPEADTKLGHHYVNYVCTRCGKSDPNKPVPESFDYTEIEESGEVVAYSVSGIGNVTATDIVIPSTHNGKPVTYIDKSAFRDNENLTTVTLPDSVVYVDDFAFWGCNNITRVNLGKGIGGFGMSAFRNCSGLDEIYYAGDLTGWCKVLDLDDIMPSGTETRKLYVDGEEIKGNLVIPDSITSLGSYTFYGCRGITSVTFHENITGIGHGTFTKCSGITSLTLPDKVKSIGSYAFQYCSGLTSVTLSSSLERFYSWAFSNCTSLTEIVIPDKVTQIEEGAFHSCTSLTQITIPDGTTSIYSSAFYNTGYYNDESNWENGVLYIGKHLISAKTTITGSCEIKDGTLTVSEIAFDGCGSLTSLIIPDSVEIIEDSAFRSCVSLQSVTIGSGVKHIGKWAFYNCESLTSAVFTNPVGWSQAHFIGLDNSSISSSTLSNPATAAAKLTDDYILYFLIRG